MTESPGLGDVLARVIAETSDLPPSELGRAVDIVGDALGATSARVLIADYSLVSLQELGRNGPTDPREAIDGSLAGRAFARGELVVVGSDPASVWVPLRDGSERLGVLELTHPAWSDDLVPALDAVVRVLVLLLISLRRYTDIILRGRRARPLSLAAEMQWDLLPPLTAVGSGVSLSGIVEPAYAIGGDSFDYALNPGRAEFAIIDAVGHGMSAVSISGLVINSLRNARREGHDLPSAYLNTGSAIRAQFGNSLFVTGQIASLELETGELTWINAGHPLPLLVRDASFAGELACRPSLPMGLGGEVVEMATVRLQPGDRVLFYTDGSVESRSPAGEPFGLPRLVDFLVRAAMDGFPPAETVRRLAATLMSHTESNLRDDSTLLIVDYQGRR